jgi:guanylate kinase
MEIDEAFRTKIEGYQPTESDLAPIKDVPILFLIGISGAGKDTVLGRLMQRHPNDFRFIVSHTTRKPRENHGVMEQDGVDYHYIDLETANALLDQKAFVEAKAYAGNVYGTSIAEIKKAQNQGKIAMGDVTVEGADEYADLKLNAKNVFLLPPSYEVWQQRLLARYDGNVHKHDLYKRMKTALVELEHALAVDYFYIVINDDLDETVELVSQIAMGEEVPPHYPKAVAIAQEIAAKTREALNEML